MLDKLTKDFLTRIIVEFNKPINKDRIYNDILEPVFSNFANKIYPYVSLLFAMYTINMVLIIVILVLIIMMKKNI